MIYYYERTCKGDDPVFPMIDVPSILKHVSDHLDMTAKQKSSVLNKLHATAVGANSKKKDAKKNIGAVVGKQQKGK
jgi:hypothetical protein